MVTIVMSLVTIFALIGDDIRVFGFDKSADNYFYGCLTVSMVLFAAEIWLNTVVIDEFKYSFFFWLDIIATLSLIIDIPWFTNVIRYALVKFPPNYESVNVRPGRVLKSSQDNSSIQQVIKSLRLIRLIRIIKLYKYAIQEKSKDETDDRQSRKKRKKKQIVQAEKANEEVEESEYKKETDPSKLGKALGDSINKKTIIGVLFMLMVLPLLSPSETDYSANYTLREAFWFGISSCHDPNGFFCNPNMDIENTLVTAEGWQEILRGMARSAENSDEYRQR